MPRRSTRRQRGGSTIKSHSRTRGSRTPERREPIKAEERELYNLFKKLPDNIINAILKSNALTERQKELAQIARKDLKQSRGSPLPMTFE